MSRIVRHNIGGGLLGNPLHTRSDLEQYHKSNFQQSNFLATPYGGIVRRQPATWLGYVRGNAAGSPPATVRGLGSVITSLIRYSVVMVAYEDGGTGFQIFGSDGTPKTSIGSPYLADDIFDVDVSQVNDVMIFTHRNYPPANLLRFGDDDWSYAIRDIEGGPFLDQNDDRELIASTGISAWQSDINYKTGDVVLPTGSVSLVANWVGTMMSHGQEATLSAEHDFSGDDPYYAPKTFFHWVQNRYATWENQVEETERPYLVVRIDEDVDASEIIGTAVSINAALVDQGSDDTYNISGTIVAVHPYTGFHYLVLNAGLSAYFTYYGTTPSYTATCTIGVQSSSFAGVPDAELPAGADSEYDSTQFRFFADTRQDARVNYNAFSGSRRNRHLFLFGSATHGGTFLQPSSNTVVGDASTSYEAISDNLNMDPASTPAVWTDLTSVATASDVLDLTTLNFAPFSEDDVGRLFTVVSELSSSDSDSFAAVDDVSATHNTSGSVTLKTEGGTWAGTLSLQTRPRGSDDTYWETIGDIVSTGDYNGTITRYLSQSDVELRVYMTEYTSGDCLWSLSMPNGDSPVYEILKFLTDNQVIVRVLSGTNSAQVASFRWSLGAFGGDQGYPAVHAVHEERLYYASTYGRPFQLWGSEVNNWENFQLGTFETSPISFRLLSDNVTRIKWLLSRSSQLYIGTDFGEYTATTPDIDSVLSALNPPRINLVTPYGSAAQQAIAVHDEVAHVVGDELTIRALAQKEYTTTETSKSLTIFDPDIAESGIKEMHLQRNPYAVIWAVRNDGKLAALTYDIENDVMGWAEIELEGADFQSHWIMPNDAGIDEVYFVDKRDDLAVIASGATLPTEVNGEYLADGSAVSISNGFNLQDSSVSRAPYEGLYQRASYDSFWHITEPYEMYKVGTDWILNHADTDTVILSVESDKQLPPFTGWTNDAGQDVGTIAYTFEYLNGSYGFAQGIDGNHYLFDGYADRNALFSRSGSIWGDYAPLGTSTGTLSVGQVAFNLEKFEYVAATAAQQNVDLNESTYTSLVEFSSLVQGPKSLERTKVRATRVVVYLVNSQGGEVSADGGETWEPIIYPDTELYTGHIDVRVNSGNVEDLRVLVRAVGSDPFHLIGVSVDIEEQGTEVS